MTIPCTAVSETEDAWLHEHCELTRFGALPRDHDITETELPTESNFIEVISSSRVKIFRCPNRPSWYGAGAWKSVAAR